MAKTCRCGKWQMRKIPCSHAIKALQHLGKMRLHILTYDIVWRMPFAPTHMHLWCQSQSHCGGMWTVQSGCLTQICCGAKVDLWHLGYRMRWMGFNETREAEGQILTWGRFNKSRVVDYVINMGITVEDVRFPVGLWQAVMIQTR